MSRKFEETSGGDADKDHILIIEELKDKDESIIKAFFGLLYDESLIEDQSLALQFDCVSDLYAVSQTQNFFTICYNNIL
jgi:hypothetical protein